MKKTVSIILIATLAVSSAVGVAAGVSKYLSSNTSAQLETRPTITQKVTETSKPTVAQTQTETKVENTYVEEDTPVVQTKVEDDYDISVVNTCYRNMSNPDHCSIEINNQYGNTLDFTITSSNENYSKIATANVSVTFDNVDEYGIPYGTSSFEYTDSFGSSGTGVIDFNSCRIILDINQEYNSGSPWNISNASGKFL
ncbi:MAG: hypothetical protein IJ275_03720 [Ruminococcus sp.]|nr:hypothetical protein [Ruminococcus sp.]